MVGRTMLEAVEVLEKIGQTNPLSRSPSPHVANDRVAVSRGVVPYPTPAHQRLRRERCGRLEDNRGRPVFGAGKAWS